MTNLKLKSTVFGLITLAILSLSVSVSFAQAQFQQGLNITDAGITIKSASTGTSELSLRNSNEENLGGFRARKFGPDANGEYLFMSGLLDKDKNFSYLHQSGKKTIFNINNKAKMIIFDSGQVVIGKDLMRWEGASTANPIISTNEYKLFVETGILTEKVKVAGLTTADWADYVFEEDYEMLPIDELEDYVKENKHLPNVPSAQDVADNGLDLAKTDATLLEKIEESHLYIIELNNKLSALQTELDAVKMADKSRN